MFCWCKGRLRRSFFTGFDDSGCFVISLEKLNLIDEGDFAGEDGLPSGEDGGVVSSDAIQPTILKADGIVKRAISSATCADGNERGSTGESILITQHEKSYKQRQNDEVARDKDKELEIVKMKSGREG